jgi:2-oxoglutarate dehydrogenase E1 component
MQVVNASTPAQIFHVLRRQVVRPMKKPLIIFSPKSLLRRPSCISTIQDLTEGSFQEMLDDPNPGDKVTRVILCSGRIYYDLIERREKDGIHDMAIVRVEQLYPFHLTLMKDILSRYPGMKEIFWVQEEPSNMGAWKFMRPMLEEVLPDGPQIKYIGRRPSASPATGSLSRHQKELSELINAVFSSEEQPFYEMSYHTIPV